MARKRRLTDYSAFISAGMRAIAPTSQAEARAAMKTLAARWRAERDSPRPTSRRRNPDVGANPSRMQRSRSVRKHERARMAPDDASLIRAARKRGEKDSFRDRQDRHRRWKPGGRDYARFHDHPEAAENPSRDHHAARHARSGVETRSTRTVRQPPRRRSRRRNPAGNNTLLWVAGGLAALLLLGRKGA